MVHLGVILGLLQVEVAHGLGLLGLRRGLGEHAGLVGRGLGLGGLAHGLGLLRGDVTRGFGFHHLGGQLDARHVGTAHVLDVILVVGDLLDREGHDAEAHLVQVLGDVLEHQARHFLGLLHDVLDRQLADDAAQVALHHELDLVLALLGGLGQELLGGGADRLLVVLHLDLGDGLHVHRHALRGVEVLLGGHIEAHQLQRELLAALEDGDDQAAAAGQDGGAAPAVHDQRLVGRDLFVDAGHAADEREHREHRDDRNSDELQGFLLFGLGG
ncbi:hypothetical protein D3C72_966270 [compost metagenome]